MKSKNSFLRGRDFFSTALCPYRTIFTLFVLVSSILQQRKGPDQPWYFLNASRAISWIAPPGDGVCEDLPPQLSPARLSSVSASPAF